MKDIKENNSHRSWSVGALVLIFLGVVLLLNNYGVIPWNAWNTLWRLWPLIFIFIGLDAVFGNSEPTRILLFVGVLVVLVYVLLSLTGDKNLPFKIPLPTPTPIPFRIRMPMYYDY